jgi:NADPH2:quinone reductase
VAHGRPLEVDDVELGAPGEGEVVVDLKFAGVNPVDRYVLEGSVAPDGPLPRTVGAEASGYVGGKPVVVCGGGLGAVRDGVWAERAIVPAASVVPLPARADLRSAGAMGIAGLTAWNVVHLAGTGANDRVLVLGAAGGVGLSVVSLASSLRATVWGQTGHAEKADAVRGQGAAEVVVATAEGLGEAVRELQPTVVIDPLGGAFTPAALAALAPGGRYVLFGTTAGPTATLQLQEFYRNGLHLLGYGGLRLTDEQRRAGLTGALAALSDGRMRVVVGRTVPLADVNAAVAATQDRSLIGKVLLDVGAPGG